MKTPNQCLRRLEYFYNANKKSDFHFRDVDLQKSLLNCVDPSSLWTSGPVHLLASRAQYYHGHGLTRLIFWQCGQVPNKTSVSIKLVSRRKHKVL